VPLFNIAILKFVWSPVTLRNGPRSNGWYGTKVMVGIIIWHIEKDLVVKSLKNYKQILFPLKYIGKVNFAL